MVVLAGAGGHVLVTLNGLFCADVLQPLDLVPLTDFTYKYHHANRLIKLSLSLSVLTAIFQVNLG